MKRCHHRDIKQGHVLQDWHKPLTFEFVQKMFNKSCHFTGRKLILKEFAEDKASIERLSNTEGHHQDNVVGIIHKLNTPDNCQWNEERLDFFAAGPHTSSQIALKVTVTKAPRQYIKHFAHRVGVDGTINCTICNGMFAASVFSKQRSAGCYQCRSEHQRRRNGGLLNALKRTVSHAHEYAKKFENNPQRSSTIILQDVIGMYERQKGICAYSGLQMSSIVNDPWKISLERIDVMQGHHKENCVLICAAFNCADRTSQLNGRKAVGSLSWSKELVDQLRQDRKDYVLRR